MPLIKLFILKYIFKYFLLLFNVLKKHFGFWFGETDIFMEQLNVQQGDIVIVMFNLIARDQEEEADARSVIVTI